MDPANHSIPVTDEWKGARFVILGSGPHSSGKMNDLLVRLGACSVGLRPGEEFTHVVVGRDGVDEKLAEGLRTAFTADEVFSQEELLAAVRPGDSLPPEVSERIGGHPGLALLLAEAGPQQLRRCQAFSERVDQRWSDLKILVEEAKDKQLETIRMMVEGFRKSLVDLAQLRHKLETAGWYPPRRSVRFLVLLEDFGRRLSANLESIRPTATTLYESWEKESELKHRYGYSVRDGIPAFRRHNALRLAIEDGIDPEKVRSHLTAFISLHEDNLRMAGAVARWCDDLRWFQENLL